MQEGVYLQVSENNAGKSAGIYIPGKLILWMSPQLQNLGLEFRAKC
jgi:hypothetical protein